MEYKTVSYAEDGQVAVITLLIPIETRDQWEQMSQELYECCERFKTNESNIVLVITEGTPGTLSMEKVFNITGSTNTASLSLARPIAALERPVLAVIVGNAIGPGLELTLACDIRIASETSYFGLPHINFGVMPWDGGTQMLSRIVGKGKALEMTLIGELINAQEALRIGLVSYVFPAAQVRANAMKIAREMSSNSPISLEYCKEAIGQGMDLTLVQGLRLEANLYFLMQTTRDREEGIKAFKKKRKPEFKGI